MKPLLLLALTTSLAFSQGPLLPPAAPAATMKSLDQIEPRTAISATTTISAPGSYYFTRSFTGSITMEASDVTLDLNGFTLFSTAHGISIDNQTSHRSITIRNGSIVGPGIMTFTGALAGSYSGGGSHGIIAFGRTPGNITGQNCGIENLTIRGFQFGIALTTLEESDGGRHLISNCIIRDFGAYGIVASQCLVRDTLVYAGAGVGVYGNALVTEQLIVNRIVGNVGIGISGNNLNLQHTVLRSCSGIGIQTSYSQISSGQISACADGIRGSDNQIDGLSINACNGNGIFSPNSTVTHVTASSNVGAGVWADSSSISHCTVRASAADGIRGINSVISNCKSSGNDTNTIDGYPAAAIVWTGGRQIDNVCDLYAPAAPAP